jgi:Flp pilus assembly pilin Flp
MIEYSLLAAFISIVAWVTVQAIGGDVQSMYTNVDTATSAAAGS